MCLIFNMSRHRTKLIYNFDMLVSGKNVLSNETDRIWASGVSTWCIYGTFTVKFPRPIIGQFRSYIIGAYFVTLYGDFATLSVICYIIGKFGVTLSVDVTLAGVVYIIKRNRA